MHRVPPSVSIKKKTPKARSETLEWICLEETKFKTVSYGYWSQYQMDQEKNR